MSMNPFGEFRSECSGLLKEALAKYEPVELKFFIPKEEFGDLSTNVCFALGKKLGISPIELAEEIASSMRPGRLVGAVRALNGYLNFRATTGLVELAIESARKFGDEYGHLRAEKLLRIIVEHTSANPIHPMHIGHARNSVLGDTISRLLRARGHQVETHFYVNDAGRQVAILAYGYDRLGRPRPAGKPDHFFGLIYAMTNCALSGEKGGVAEKEPKMYEELARAIGQEEPEKSISGLIKAYELGEKWAIELIRPICEACVEGFRETLDKLGIRMDAWDWESDLLWSGKVAELLARLLKSGAVRRKDGALVLEAGPLPPLVLTRSDGTTLYELRDAAYALEKLGKADLVINVIGAEQRLAQLHVKAILEAIGEGEKASRMIHFSYGLVKLPGVKMSARRGQYVSLDELIEEIVERARREVEARSPGLPEGEKEEVAKAVGIGALKFALLAQDPDKEITFDLEHSLDFKANSAPYIQYTYARACSILRKAGREPEQPDYGLLRDPLEHKIAVMVARFPEVVASAADDLRPHILADYVLKLSDEFNSFYAKLPVLKAKPKELSDARLALVDAVRIVIRNALELLGIPFLERM